MEGRDQAAYSRAWGMMRLAAWTPTDAASVTLHHSTSAVPQENTFDTEDLLVFCLKTGLGNCFFYEEKKKKKKKDYVRRLNYFSFYTGGEKFL